MLGAAVLLGVGCTEPQSGSHAAAWCQAADPGVVVVDDMEDHDGSLCRTWPGAWRVDVANPTGATTVPTAGPLATTDDLTGALLSTDRQPPSARGLHLTGSGFGSTSIAAATLGAVFAAPLPSFAPYTSLKLWVSSPAEVSIRVNLALGAELASASRWGSAVTVGPGQGWAQVKVDLGALTPDSTTPGAAPDLSSVAAIEVTYANFIKDAAGANPPGGTFDLWIDDVAVAP